MYSTTTMKGEIACTKVELRAFEKGFVISKPIIECRYDRIVDDGKRLYKVQVKYADGKHTGATGSSVVGLARRKGRRSSKAGPYYCYNEEIDAVLVYVPSIDKICWFGPESFRGKTSISIRTQPAANGQTKGCVMATDYEW
jgi:hypothetical protein